MDYEPMKHDDMDSDTRKEVGQLKKNINKKQNPLRKVIMNAIKTAVMTMLAKMLPFILGAIFIITLITGFQMILDGNGEDADDDKTYENDLLGATNVTDLSSYLLQFSHTDEAPQSADGKYYKMYSDGKWPTIGNADLQWLSHEGKFDRAGKVLSGGEEKTVSSVKDYVNGFLTRGSSAEYTVEEIDAMNIYIEKELVDSIGAAICESVYSYVETETSELSLSKQQLYALTAIAYNFGHLPERNGYTFKSVYESGAALYEINSWEHNRFIWDNWWYALGGGFSGHIPARDAAFETYVKGAYDFSQSAAGEVFSRNYYIYYTRTQLNTFDYAPDKTITRDITDEANEIEIFTYNKNDGASLYSGDILAGCQAVMQDLLNHNVKYSLTDLCWNNIEQSSDFSKYKCCCATYVSVVLYRTGLLTEDFINKYNYNYTGGISSGGVCTMLRDAGWTLVNVDAAQAGDVCVYDGHTFIYAGGDAIWDQNSGCISSSGSQPARGTLNLWNYYINKCNSSGVKLYVWRAP